MTYRILKPCECFNCGGDCFAVTWSKEKNPTGKADIFWKCKKCGRQFVTSKNIDEITIVVEKLPELPYFVAHEILE